jgi:hypothetical protein
MSDFFLLKFKHLAILLMKKGVHEVSKSRW